MKIKLNFDAILYYEFLGLPQEYLLNSMDKLERLHKYVEEIAEMTERGGMIDKRKIAQYTLEKFEETEIMVLFFEMVAHNVKQKIMIERMKKEEKMRSSVDPTAQKPQTGDNNKKTVH